VTRGTIRSSAAIFGGRGLVAPAPRNAAEVVEKFAEYVEVIIPAPNLEPVQSHGEIDCFRQWPPNNSLKRASFAHEVVKPPARGSQLAQGKPGERARGQRP
jgi:hypothetical protein